MQRVSFRRLLTKQEGSIDLAPIVVGVLVLGILSAGYLATATTAVPWAQDNAARQLLSNVVIAETANNVRTSDYTDYHTLAGNGLVPTASSLTIAVNTEGSCYAASSRSDSGKLFYVTDLKPSPTDVQPAALKHWTPGDPIYGSCEPASLPLVPAPAVPAGPSPVDWRAGVQPANSQTKVLSVEVTVTSTNAFCMNISLTGTTSTPSPWALTVDTSLPPWYGRAAKLWSSESVTFADTSTSVWTVNGNGGPPTGRKSSPWNNTWNNSWISAGHVYNWSLCESSMQAPPNRAEAYTATVVRSTTPGEWGGTKNCMVATMQGTGAYPFYAGWSQTIDMTAAVNDFSTRRITTSFVSWSPNGSVGQTVTPNGPGVNATSYLVTDGRDNAVIAAQSTVFKLCVNGY